MKKSNPIDTTSPEFVARAAERRRTWSMTRYSSLDAMKAAEYRSWAQLSDTAKFAAISEVSAAAFALKGTHVQRLHRPHRTPE